MPEPKLKLVPPERQVIATAVSIVVGVTDDRQMTFQTGFQGDETPEEINRRFDGIMELADRQQAKYKLIKARKDLVKLEKTFAEFLEDKAKVEAKHVKDQAARDVQAAELVRLRDEERKVFVADMDVDILKLQDLRKERWVAGQEESQKRGRLGGYKPAGADKAAIDRIDSAIKKAGEARDIEIARWEKAYDAKIEALAAEIHSAEEDRAQHAGNLKTSIERYEEAILAAKEEIVEFEGLIGG